jgi:uncharacterized membrane protein YccF (DUF307 family)
MVPMRLIGNIIWLVFGGLFLALGYVVAGVINCVFIITIPFGVASFRLAGYALWPFGRVVVDRGKGSGSGIRLIGNIIWLVFGGLWLALGHLFAALLCAITIIGIPFAIAHLRLAGLALMPLGKQIVAIDEARRSGETPAVGVALAPTRGD